jgi:hypothetical protein
MMAEDMIREDPDLIPDSTFVCPECSKVYPNAQALSGHVMSHIPAEACPECGRDDFKSANAQARHRSQMHGVVPAYRKNQSTTPKVPGRIGRPPRAAVDRGMSVDAIFQSVVQTLYPGGQMPVWAVTPLVQWREATQEMLDHLQGE